MTELIKMTDAAIAAKKNYYAAYRKKNKSKKAIYNIVYWNKKAAEQAKAE